MKQTRWIYLVTISTVIISAIAYAVSWSQPVVASQDDAAPATNRIVTKTADTNDGVCNADCSLREAIAASAAGDSIVFSSLFNSPQTISLTSALSITKTLTVTGTSSRNVILARPTGASVPDYRIFEIVGDEQGGVSVRLNNLTVTNGRASSGAGIYVGIANLFLDSVTIQNNTTTGGFGGGGVVNDPGSMLNIVNSSISNNVAASPGQGGGIYSSGTLNIANSSITANQAASGGGVRAGGTTIFNNVTISLNASTDNSGGVRVGSNNSFFRNSIIAQNSAPLGPDIGGTATSLGNNLLGNSSFAVGFINGVNGDKVGTAAAPLNPQLGLLLNNGGQTDTRAPGATSPALNSANACVIAANCPSHNPPLPLQHDQRGFGFSRAGGAAVDMGAVELPGTPTISGLSPAVRGVNTGSFQVSVTGTGFVASSVIRWNGSNRVTTYSSPTQIRATILASDIQTLQTVPITVFTPLPGGGTSNGSNFTVVSCAFDPEDVNLPRTAGSWSVEVGAVNGCSKTATTNASWITNLRSSAPSFLGTLLFDVQANNGPPRTGSITVTTLSSGVEVTFLVTQAGCSYSLLPATSASVPASAGSFEFQVNTGIGCTWNAVSNHAFISITGQTGTGTGLVMYSIAANTGPARMGTITAGGQTFTVNQAAGAAPRRVAFDFDGDGKTDVGIFRPPVGEWWYRRSSDGFVPAFQFGVSTDRIVPADYTGDGKTDIAFWRPSTGEWYILRSENLSFFSFPFGSNGDIPAPADYDNDGKADPAVFRPSSATWFIQRSSDNGTTIAQFGANGDVPVAADYDGDGRADLAIYRPSLGQWWLNRSTAGVIAMTFGNSTDKAVQGDYTGDGKADVAFWRPSTGEWYVLRSEDMSYYSAPFGAATDTPAPGDYDGDGKFDTAVFRPSQATWFIQRSTAGTLIQQFGANGDKPVPNAFVP